MEHRGKCPYTKSGTWPDSKLVAIIEDSLKTPNPRCPDCDVEGVVRGSGEVAWCECPECGVRIGETLLT